MVLAAATSSWAESYKSWNYVGCVQKRQYFTEYSYTNSAGKTSHQTVVYIPHDSTLKRWYYFYKGEHAWKTGEKPWGRVHTANHPEYNAKTMKWQYWKDGKWNDYKQPGFCPAPKDAAKPIMNIPPLPPK